MTARPILFSAPMVLAILDGRKTQTRREVKPQPDDTGSNGGKITGVRSSSIGWGFDANYFGDNPRHVGECPYGKPGDRLWVKETWQYWDWTEDGQPFVRYAADESTRLCSPPEDWAERVEDVWARLSGNGGPARDAKWRPSIFMPRWASRITLEIVAVRVERLNDISEEDAKAEGVACDWQNSTLASPIGSAIYRKGFELLWQSIHGPGTFDGRWVWVVEFKKVEASE